MNVTEAGQPWSRQILTASMRTLCPLVSFTIALATWISRFRHRLILLRAWRANPEAQYWNNRKQKPVSRRIPLLQSHAHIRDTIRPPYHKAKQADIDILPEPAQHRPIGWIGNHFCRNDSVFINIQPNNFQLAEPCKYTFAPSAADRKALMILKLFSQKFFHS